jgi:ribonuclease VapC
MTIVIDTSAIVAILTQEEAGPELVRKASSVERCLLPAPCAAEALMVMTSKGKGDLGGELNELYRQLNIHVVPFSSDHLLWFQHAFERYGKGRHKAALNFGDCFSYAVAKEGGYPLLFIGNDFALTDLAAV